LEDHTFSGLSATAYSIYSQLPSISGVYLLCLQLEDMPYYNSLTHEEVLRRPSMAIHYPVNLMCGKHV
jgi:hypothetical protein